MTIKEEIKKECKRIEENCIYSSKAHYNTSACLDKCSQFLGFVILILPFVSAKFINDIPIDWLRTILIISGTLAGINLFFGFAKKVEQNKKAGNEYKRIEGEVRIFGNLSPETRMSDAKLKEGLAKITNKMNSTRDESPSIPTWAYNMAKKGIERGEHKYEVDEEK